MKTKVPKVKTLLSFLFSKGWKLEKVTKLHYVLAQPDEFEVEGHAPIYIPLNEEFLDYLLVIMPVVEDLAELYKVEKNKLIETLSQDLKDIKAEVALKQTLLLKRVKSAA